MSFIKSSKHDSLFFIHDMPDIVVQGMIQRPMYQENNLNYIDLILNHSSKIKTQHIQNNIETFFRDQSYYASDYDTFRVQLPMRYGKINIPIETKNNHRLLLKDLIEDVVINVKIKPTSTWIDHQFKLNIMYKAVHIVANIEYSL